MWEEKLVPVDAGPSIFQTNSAPTEGTGIDCRSGTALGLAVTAGVAPALGVAGVASGAITGRRSGSPGWRKMSVEANASVTMTRRTVTTGASDHRRGSSGRDPGRGR